MRVEYIILLILLGLEWVGAGISSSGDGNNDNTTNSMMSSTASFNIITDDPPFQRRSRHRAEGGLHWRDLGVSLANCPWTTARMLDKYNSDPSLDSTTTTSMDDGRKRQWQCMDDSAWLLHPSSGFVENGSLCGILGPR
jgi:hypothetical protein